MLMPMIEMQLSRIVIRETSDQQSLHLKEKDGERQFPIVIGMFEAWAIDRRVRDRKTPRPMTHDLMASLIQLLGATLERVVISDLKNNTFYAKLHLSRGAEGGPIQVDARPSDAIALAVHLDAPIYVEDEVIATVLETPPPEEA
jgi:bifunctional DNase/RNase